MFTSFICQSTVYVCRAAPPSLQNWKLNGELFWCLFFFSAQKIRVPGNIDKMDKPGSQSGGEPKNPMTQDAAARIQSSEAKQHGGGVPKGSFSSRAQSTADKRANQNN